MIKSFKVNGFRLLDQFEAELGDLTVVIGANATGKSTLIDCLRLVSQCAEFPIQKALHWHGFARLMLNAAAQAEELGWNLTFEMPRNNPLWSNVPLGDRAYSYKVSLRIDPYGQVIPVYEVLQNQTPYPGYEQPFKYLESAMDRSMVFDPRQKQLVPFDEALPQERGGGALGGQLPVAAPAREGPPQAPVQERSLRLAQMRFFNEYPILSWVRTLISSMAFYPGFDIGRSSHLRAKAAEIRPETLLFPTGENLGTVLHEVLTRHDHRHSAELLKDFLRAAYPSFEDVSAETTFGVPPSVMVRVRETGMTRPMEMWDLSDGMLRFLCLGTALLNPLPPPFMAFDEPEAGLHPRLLPIVADMIKTASERSQILITTHSPDLLNRFDLSEIAVMSREGPHAKWKRPGNRESLRQMLEGVAGETIGDLHRSGELEAIE